MEMEMELPLKVLVQLRYRVWFLQRYRLGSGQPRYSGTRILGTPAIVIQCSNVYTI